MKQIITDVLDGVGRLLLYDPSHPILFNTSLFLFLFAGMSLIYASLERRTTLRLLFVTLFSYYFYYKSSGFAFVLLAFVTVSDYLLALAIDRSYRRSVSYAQTGRVPLQARILLFVSIVTDLALLGYFKYAYFFSQISASLGGPGPITWDIILPVGISFFTFQSLSYTIDVYRRQLTPLRHLLDYAFYVSFFPQLVAGPIVRASEFIPQIRRPLRTDATMFGRGVFLICCGIFKKAIISDYISVNFVDRIFDNPLLYSGIENLCGIYGYALQIYCDFSGYSDMAIGLALLLGFHFPENFCSPYKSASVSEFWHRWHISLSTWLRDYLYIPLGGNRCGVFRNRFNLLLTMLLGGLWHGASWNFVLWGGLHGLALIVHKACFRCNKAVASPWLRLLKRGVACLLTFHFVCFCWLIFRHTDMTGVGHMLHQIFTDFHAERTLLLWSNYRVVFIIMAVGYALHFCPHSCSVRVSQVVQRMPLLLQALLIAIIVYAAVQVQSGSPQPFIYFRF